MIYSTPFILLTIIHPDYNFFGTIVTFDGGYSLWRHYDKANSNGSSKRKRNKTLLFQWERRKRNMGRNDVRGILPA
jgi:hypothetical protein